METFLVHRQNPSPGLRGLQPTWQECRYECKQAAVTIVEYILFQVVDNYNTKNVSTIFISFLQVKKWSLERLRNLSNILTLLINIC